MNQSLFFSRVRVSNFSSRMHCNTMHYSAAFLIIGVASSSVTQPYRSVGVAMIRPPGTATHSSHLSGITGGYSRGRDSVSLVSPVTIVFLPSPDRRYVTVVFRGISARRCSKYI